MEDIKLVPKKKKSDVTPKGKPLQPSKVDPYGLRRVTICITNQLYDDLKKSARLRGKLISDFLRNILHTRMKEIKKKRIESKNPKKPNIPPKITKLGSGVASKVPNDAPKEDIIEQKKAPAEGSAFQEELKHETKSVKKKAPVKEPVPITVNCPAKWRDPKACEALKLVKCPICRHVFKIDDHTFHHSVGKLLTPKCPKCGKVSEMVNPWVSNDHKFFRVCNKEITVPFSDKPKIDLKCPRCDVDLEIETPYL